MDNRIKLFLLSSSNMYALNGAAKFVKIFYDNTNVFEKYSIELIVCANNNAFSNEHTYRKTHKFKIKNYIKRSLSKTTLGKIVKYYLLNIVTTQKPMNEFNTYEKEGKVVVILNDLDIAKAYYKKYSTRYKTIFIMHNSGDIFSMLSELHNIPLIKQEQNRLWENILNNTNNFICVGKNGLDIFKKLYPIAANKAINISIGQPSYKTIVKRSYDVLKMVCVGSISDRKNQISILEAVNEIGDKNILLTLVGSGPTEEQCKNYVNAHGLSEQIVFAGAQNNVWHYLENANIFILTSKDEGLPIAIQEAMNVGLALIVTDVGGCAELINGNGILINSEHSEIVRAIKWFNEHKDKIEEYGKRSKELFEEKYTLEIMIKQYAMLINEI